MLYTGLHLNANFICILNIRLRTSFLAVRTHRHSQERLRPVLRRRSHCRITLPSRGRGRDHDDDISGWGRVVLLPGHRSLPLPMLDDCFSETGMELSVTLSVTSAECLSECVSVFH